MVKTTLKVFVVFILLVVGFSIGQGISDSKNEFSCDNLGVMYVTDSELMEFNDLVSEGIVLYAPASDTIKGNSDIFECDNVEMYLHPII